MIDPDEDIGDRWERLRKAREKRDAVRRVPILHAKAPLGTCKWCGKPVLYPQGHKREGEVNTRKGWHDACLADFFLHSRPDVQREFLNQRDGEKCAQCGAAPLRVLRGAEGSVWAPRRHDVHQGPYCEIRIVVWLHVDHTIPLWKIRHLPDADRVKYFGPGNIALLCDGPDCHGGKTAAEATERAHFKNLGEKWQTHQSNLNDKQAGKTKATSSRWPKGRQLRSRPLRSSRPARASAPGS